MNNHTADYPLGQQLLLTPMAKGLNDNNLALLQLKAKQASFCNQVVTVTTQVICHLDTTATFLSVEGTQNCSLRGLLMQVAHPTNDTCAFFQVIDNYSVGQGVACTMLPSAAAFGCNAIIRLIPFTRWLLKPVYGKWQSYNLDLAFHPAALQDMAVATWDKSNNCVQQKEGDLLVQALKDLDIYNLHTKLEATPPAVVLVDTMGMAFRTHWVTQAQFLHKQTGSATQTMAPTQQQDNDSLTNLIQSQNTIFTQAIHQMDNLAE